MVEEKKVVRRATAKICPLVYLTQGSYIVQEGWQPNYVQVGSDQITRINIIGIVVQKQNQNSFFVDDGTSSIRVVDFSQTKVTQQLAVGDPVLIIGRPRKTEEELFIASEIITSKQLTLEPHWLEDRQTALNEYTAPEQQPVASIEPVAHQPVTVQLTGDDVVDFMKKKDTGEGCIIEEIVSYFGKDVEDVIHTLLAMGEIYEIKSGVVKVLE